MLDYYSIATKFTSLLTSILSASLAAVDELTVRLMGSHRVLISVSVSSGVRLRTPLIDLCTLKVICLSQQMNSLNLRHL